MLTNKPYTVVINSLIIQFPLGDSARDCTQPINTQLTNP